MPTVAQLPNPKSEPENSAQTETDRAHKIAQAVEVLLGSLPLAERESVIRMLAESIRPEPSSKAGDVLGTILRFLPKRHDWTVGEIKKGVDAHGVKATDKQVFNAIGHLTRKGHVTRVGYGRYIVAGIVFETADDLGGEPSRTEKMDAN